MRRRGAIAAVAVLFVGGAVLVGKACLGGGGRGPRETGLPKPMSSEEKPASTAAVVVPKRPRPSSAAPDGGAPAGPAIAASAAWGGHLGELGRERPTEGNPEGPMSLTVDGKGRMLVLDQVNNRVVRYGPDGKPEKEIRADIRTAQDVAVADDGTIAVLDRFTDKAVTLYNDSGEVVGKLPLVGEGVDEPGNVTGLFLDDTGVYAERQHGPLVKVGDTSGHPAEPRTEIPGRPSRDGLSYINAGIVDAQAGRAYVSSIDRATMEGRFTRELRLEAYIATLVLLDTDRSGTIYFGALVGEGANDEMIEVVCLEPTRGQPIGVATMPANTLPEETFRDLAVLDDGGILYALRSESGVAYQRYDCK